MNKDYLFLLDSYCFIWKDPDHILIYNTLSGKGYIYANVPVLCDFVDKLMLKDNLYSISVSSQELSNKSVADFIYSMRENFCGDLFSRDAFQGKPIVLFPEMNINEDVNRNLDDINSSAVFGSTILRNLTDIYLELGGSCKYDCKDCSDVYRQIEWCYRSDRVMPVEIVNKIFEDIKYANVFDLHFIGGNLLNYPFWDDLLFLISTYAEVSDVSMNFNINVKGFRDTCYRDKINDLLRLVNVHLKVYIDFSDLSEDLYTILLNLKDKAEFFFRVVDEKQALCVSEFSNSLDIEFTILPYYTGNNMSFFKKYVFMGKDDILDSSLSKKDIFSHQVLNANYFGKLYVKANGDICSNLISSPIGSYQEGLLKIVYEELKKGTFWRKTRDQVEPCRDCLYKYLCPSPSTYEEAIGQYNLCDLKD